MATALVEPFVAPELHRTTPLQRRPCALAPPLPPVDSTATQLAPLASQHHTSEYNRLKFGFQGCPIRYLPLSIHLPDIFRDLQLRQAQCSEGKSWWPCKKIAAPKSPSTVILGPRGAQPQETANLEDEIEAAITAPLYSVPKVPLLHPTEAHSLLHPPVKTSSTHPINISSIVPPELVPLISSHLLLTSSPDLRPSPTMFEISPSFALDRLTPTDRCQNNSQVQSAPISPTSNQFAVAHLRTRSSVTEALQAAINSGLSAVNVDATSNETKRATPSATNTFVARLRPASADAPPSYRTLSSLHINASSISSSPSLIIATPSSAPAQISTLSTPRPPSCSPTRDEEPQRPFLPTSSPSQEHKYERVSITLPSSSLHPPPPISPPPPFSIGNLFLSSCPGKKVRLQGPVNGRSGVCRDLATDLKRIKELGVECIICCLDDDELEFLGAPWPEYERRASDYGIDVLRIPIPEGLAPLTPASLNQHLTDLIKAYTLHGVPILVHCRGGVGRAGVIACCWVIKLGLCGWVEADGKPTILSAPPPPLRSNGLRAAYLNGPSSMSITPTIGSNHSMGAGILKRDTIQYVEKVIAVVRRRRSMKAIETYEQVKFLVDFVEYLRER